MFLDWLVNASILALWYESYMITWEIHSFEPQFPHLQDGYNVELL